MFEHKFVNNTEWVKSGCNQIDCNVQKLFVCFSYLLSLDNQYLEHEHRHWTQVFLRGDVFAANDLLNQKYYLKSGTQQNILPVFSGQRLFRRNSIRRIFFLCSCRFTGQCKIIIRYETSKQDQEQCSHCKHTWIRGGLFCTIQFSIYKMVLYNTTTIDSIGSFQRYLL